MFFGFFKNLLRPRPQPSKRPVFQTIFKMQIKEIQTREEIQTTLNVMLQIYDELNHKTYADNILEMMENGYKMASVVEDEICIGVVGIRVVQKLHYGLATEIEDFMIDRQKRGLGVGKILMRWVEWQAANSGCKNIIGNLETKRQASQKIYSREKFVLDGFFFRKNC